MTSLADIVRRYRIELHRVGRELRGNCPFHDNQSFAFSVSEEKQLFYCFSCGAGGDVIRFVELIERCSFKQACNILDIENHRPRPRPHRSEAEKITSWAYATSIKTREALRRLSDKIRVCALARKQQGIDTDLIVTHEAALIREWAILCDLDDDLNDPKVAIELYTQCADVERLVESAI